MSAVALTLIESRGGDPAWAVPYVPGSVPDWRDWHGPTMRGMAADPALRHAGWDVVSWTQLRRPSPSGSDRDTWFAVHHQPLPGSDVYPCMHFSGWDHVDGHGRATKGAPLRIAVYPGLWRDCDAIWSFDCYWAPYTDWCVSGVLERVWASAARRVHFGSHGPLVLDGEEGAARKRSEVMRRDWGWTRRSVILVALPNDAPNDFVRNLNRSLSGKAWEDFQAARVQERAEHLCWQQAEDDLPWLEFAPTETPFPDAADSGSPAPRRRALHATGATAGEHPRALSLFDRAEA